MESPPLTADVSVHERWFYVTTVPTNIGVIRQEPSRTATFTNVVPILLALVVVAPALGRMQRLDGGSFPRRLAVTVRAHMHGRVGMGQAQRSGGQACSPISRRSSPVHGRRARPGSYATLVLFVSAGFSRSSPVPIRRTATPTPLRRPEAEVLRPRFLTAAGRPGRADTVQPVAARGITVHFPSAPPGGRAHDRARQGDPGSRCRPTRRLGGAPPSLIAVIVAVAASPLSPRARIEFERRIDLRPFRPAAVAKAARRPLSA
jgi:hypothetical protein